MDIKKANKIVAGLVTIAALIFTTIGIRPQIDRLFNIADKWYDTFFIIGIIFLFIALIFFLIPRIVPRLKRTQHIVCAKAKWNQLEDVHTFCEQILGEEVATLERLQNWYSKNSEVIHIIYLQNNFQFRQVKKIIGVFSVFPLTQAATKLFSQNQLKGSEILEQHITKRTENATAIYIGAVVGKGFRGRQQTLLALIGYITSLVEKKISIIFTRPITPDGRRLAKQYEFVSVIQSYSKETDTIYFLSLSDESLN